MLSPRSAGTPRKGRESPLPIATRFRTWPENRSHHRIAIGQCPISCWRGVPRLHRRDHLICATRFIVLSEVRVEFNLWTVQSFCHRRVHQDSLVDHELERTMEIGFRGTIVPRFPGNLDDVPGLIDDQLACAEYGYAAVGKTRVFP